MEATSNRRAQINDRRPAFVSVTEPGLQAHSRRLFIPSARKPTVVGHARIRGFAGCTAVGTNGLLHNLPNSQPA